MIEVQIENCLKINMSEISNLTFLRKASNISLKFGCQVGKLATNVCDCLRGVN